VLGAGCTGDKTTRAANADGTAEPPAAAAAPVDQAGEVDSGVDDVAPEPPRQPVMAGHGPLVDAEAELFFGSAEDAPPKVLDAQLEKFEGRHFLYSDEENPDRFYERIKDLGGGYVGVGTDQGYLFIGWMKPHLAWLADYDQWVVFLHRAYFAFFDAAETVDAFLDLWSPDREESSIALLKRVYGDDANRRLIVEVFKAGRSKIYAKLRRLRRVLTNRKVPGFVTDQEQYTFVRELIAARRVRPMLGNLLADKGLVGIARVSRELEVPVRALYLSNAESYWPYSDQFRRNVRGMSFDDRSLIMRTFATKPKNKDYCYSTQDAANFRLWLERPFVKSVRQVWQEGRRVQHEEHYPFHHIDEPPHEP